MAGKLDEISRVIGKLEESVASLGRSLDTDRRLANQRHQENSGTLEKIDGRVNTIEQAMAPLANAVEAMKPIVNGYQITRWKLAGALALGVIIVTLIGWVVSLFAGKVLGLIFVPK